MSEDDWDPPESVVYSLDEALRLLETLENAWDTLMDAGYLAGVVELDDQIVALVRKLGMADPEGGLGDD